MEECPICELFLPENELSEHVEKHVDDNIQNNLEKAVVDLPINIDLYKLLEVPSNAQTEEIKQSFRRKSIQNHSDKFLAHEDKQTAEENFKLISKAKDILTNEKARILYDSKRCGLHFCRFCSLSFQNEAELFDHLTFKCESCEFSCCDITTYVTHQSKHELLAIKYCNAYCKKCSNPEQCLTNLIEKSFQKLSKYESTLSEMKLSTLKCLRNNLKTFFDDWNLIKFENKQLLQEKPGLSKDFDDLKSKIEAFNEVFQPLFEQKLNQKKRKCVNCDDEFYSKRKLSKHVETVHFNEAKEISNQDESEESNKSNLICPYCMTQFEKADLFASHLLNFCEKN